MVEDKDTETEENDISTKSDDTEFEMGSTELENDNTEFEAGNTMSNVSIIESKTADAKINELTPLKRWETHHHSDPYPVTKSANGPCLNHGYTSPSKKEKTGSSDHMSPRPSSQDQAFGQSRARDETVWEFRGTLGYRFSEGEEEVQMLVNWVPTWERVSEVRGVEKAVEKFKEWQALQVRRGTPAWHGSRRGRPAQRGKNG